LGDRYVENIEGLPADTIQQQSQRPLESLEKPFQRIGRHVAVFRQLVERRAMNHRDGSRLPQNLGCILSHHKKLQPGNREKQLLNNIHRIGQNRAQGAGSQQQQQDNKSVTLQLVVLPGQPGRQNARQNTAAVQRRNRQQIDQRQ